MTNKNDQTIRAYLNQIDSGPLLTREQEEELIRNVEVFQKQILEQIIVSTYPRNELKTYLLSLDSSGESIIDISKKLDEESNKDLVSSVESNFKALIKALAGNDIDVIKNLLTEVALTGTIIHGVVTEIKKKHSKIIEAEGKFNQVRKYFTNETDDQLRALISTDDACLKSKIQKEYMLSEVKVTNKFNEWKQLIQEFDAVVMLIADATFQEIKEAFQSISSLESKAQQFKNTLITKNLRLVISRAKKFKDKGLEFEDLIQEGNLGLMKAVDKFDSSKKTKVSTYATWWIDQSIRRAISNKGKTVRIPTHIEWMQTVLAKKTNELVAKLKREPTIEELSEASGYSVKEIEESKVRAQHEISMEQEIDEDGRTLHEVLQSHDDGPFTLVEKKIQQEKVRELVDQLPIKYQKLLRLRYGIGDLPDSEGQTLQSIADVSGITKQGVRVGECAAIKMLRKKAARLA